MPTGRTRLCALRPLLLLPAALLFAACQSFSPQRSADALEPAPTIVVEELEPITVPPIELREPMEENLLVRLREGFALTMPNDPSIARERAWYGRNQEYIDRVFQRADLYLFYIVEELEKRGLPRELALLPVIESAFDPFAYSRSRASGLWQIIPGTGRKLGLAQNWWFDGRRDVLESTRAALDYLEALNKEFDGDWLLAVAGYNSGEANVERAIKRAKAAKKPTDFWGIKNYLPAETRTYVPRLLAVCDLVAHPELYGITLPEIPNQPRFAVVSTGGQIDMALAADLAGIDHDALYALNAGVNRWATDPEGPHRLLLPMAQAEQFESSLAALGERERVQWSRHKVKQGESIGALAAKYDTTVAVLREINGLRGNSIRAGDELLIPQSLKAVPRFTPAAAARVQRQQGVAFGARSEHIVKSGESLWSISRAYGVDVKRLASWNSMTQSDVLNVGRSLVIWSREPEAEAKASGSITAAVATNPAPGAVAAASPLDVVPAALSTEPPIRQVTYVVRRGDSLSSIARHFRVTLPKLLEWNEV
ncbi:MAG TPA: LysM peptidoglycan-binding domain-containing protein, partial [Gammaproteobacteria bacterium]|nr:LysM peptidoglycan-binding domain-containing protein [Gammaproteobacteria bacterium]